MLAAVARDTQERTPRNSQSWNSAIPGIDEEYVTQVSEEVEGRVIKKVSQEFTTMESRFLVAQSKLDKFLRNPQFRVQSGTVPGTSRNINVENQERTRDRSQNDCLETDASVYRSAQNMHSDPEETSYNHQRKT